MQTKKSEPVRGTWVRWSRYDLLDGLVIPAAGAELEDYDPWQQFRANEGKYRTVQQPYTALLELHRQLKTVAPRFSPGGQPSQVSDSPILEWCNRHGLLGLVPILHEEIQVDENVRYVRWGATWDSIDVAHGSAAKRWSPESLEPLRPSPYAFWFGPATIDEGEGIPTFLADVALVKAPLHPIYFFIPTRFRGADGQSFRLPRPCSRAFWHSYGEPTAQIAAYVSSFGTCVDSLSQWTSDSDSPRALHAIYFLSKLAEKVSQSFTLDSSTGRVKEETVSAGLLASYALMFLWDLVAGRRALQCQNCESYFVSDEHRARYCSPTCRNTAQSRRYRERKQSGDDN